jgi:serine/threonine protein kinase
MAPHSGSSHSFQKLKLDTSAPHRPLASTFDSIPRCEPRHEDTPEPQPTATFGDADARYPPEPRHHGAHAHPIPIKRESSGAHGHPSYNGGSAAVSSGSSAEDDLVAQFRRRSKSIAFNDHVTLDSGNRITMDEPLPKPRRRHSRPDTPDSELSNHDFLEMPRAQRKGQQHQVGELRYPLLQATVDELAEDMSSYHDEYHDQVASLTSEATAASPAEEVRTPLETPTDYILSPLQTSSPMEFPSYFGRRNGSQRSKSYRDMYDGDGSLRRTSRRSSGRSGRSLSSMSPAASFLARYKSTDGVPLKPIEPDDEGQGIGYEGEYIIGKQIGYGGFSIVKEVTSMTQGERVVDAVKIVHKQLKDKSELENEQIQSQFDHEVEIWRFLRHPYILPLLRVYTTDFATFCITKLNKGGTLFDLVRDLRRKKKAGLPLHLAKRYTYQLASAMRYLHNDVQVVHRDIKLENCLLDMTVPNADVVGGNVLLCDFGMADFIVSDQRDSPEPPHSTGANQNIGPGETSTSIAGSLQYAAPELFSAPGPLFSPAADVWALGVVIYTLLTVNLPFDEGLDAKTAMKIQKGEYDLELLRNAEALQGEGAEDALELVKGCLEMDPERRWTVHDVLECPWLAECAQQLEDVSRSWLAGS